jgi:hypothetical protein
MRVLPDECVPRKFKNGLSVHECQTVPEAGLAGKKNGELLSLAEGLSFAVLITMDKGVQYEQNLSGRRIAIIVLRSTSNRLTDLVSLVPHCREQLATINPGQLVHVGLSRP